MPWTDRLLAIRDRWLSNPKFQRWAASFPLTRPTARRRARALFDVCAGFVYSQILYACVRLKLFELLAKGPDTAQNIASALDLSLDSTERLLEAAVSLRLLDKRPADRFGLGSLGAALIGNPGVSAMVEHHSMLYTDLVDPVSLLRREKPTTELSSYWTYGKGGSAAEYTELMANSQPLVAGEILDAYPVAKHRCLLDVGGGDGSFLIEVAKRAPELQLRLFDLPPVAERAAQRFASLSISTRATAYGGDFLHEPLPEGSDLISLVRVIHDHDDGPAASILTAAYRALPEGGALLLAEPMKGTEGAEPVGDAYFGFYLLAMGRGRPRTPNHLQQLLREAGFSSAQLLRTHQPLQVRLIVAKK